ncbi:hypothetical protein GQ43DRAFT_369843 [Delitschia confertaspora ATCC 74209]|uniref:Uncharacterized protein n=1 Tax=Delitschia confertaspora ATCC 74209 TaxID=1513339 RepID=A0A9P4JMG5_9PLEO|nr:hypothetical protein GQ43DRAFT_369843 [Delitschia confertaspora ATCC 74209]
MITNISNQNLFHQTLYFNIEYTREHCSSPVCGGIPKKFVQLHIDHCIELIRMRLMCTADLGVVPLMWL